MYISWVELVGQKGHKLTNVVVGIQHTQVVVKVSERCRDSKTEERGLTHDRSSPQTERPLVMD